MAEYTPDRWVMLKITPPNNKFYYKIFASWSGSYLYGASWKLNSGVTRVEMLNDTYKFHGFSGSVYVCHKNSYGTTNYGASVLSNLLNPDQYTNIVDMMPDTIDPMTLEY